MRGNWVRVLVLPLLLAVGLGACASNGVQPGIVSTSGTPTAAPPAGGVQQASYPAQGSAAGPVTGEPGRVVSIREVGLSTGGSHGSGGNGAFLGGLLGAGAGATLGAITSNTVGGGLVGALLGAVGGAIAGTIANGGGAGTPGRGIEVTVQRDDGQQVTIAQPDDGDIQLGDRVQIVQNRQGVAQVVRAPARTPE